MFRGVWWCMAIFIVAVIAWSQVAVSGSPGSDLKWSGGTRAAGPLVPSHAPAIYRCVLTSARAWDAGEFVTTTRYSDKPCLAGEMETVVDVVQSVVEHYKPIAGSRGGSVPSVR
jgi:hypothetical protein